MSGKTMDSLLELLPNNLQNIDNLNGEYRLPARYLSNTVPEDNLSSSPTIKPPVVTPSLNINNIKNSTSNDRILFRTIDGSYNNLLYIELGKAETQLLRLFQPAYEDGIAEPRGGGIKKPLTLPNPRDISNKIAKQTTSVPNYLNASDWLWQWGQFIDHDLDLNEGGDEEFLIKVNDLNDPLYPGYIPFTRVPAASGTGTSPYNPRQQKNDITAFIDASSVYGSDETRANYLRTHDGTGKLKTQVINGEELLPFNTVGLANANPFKAPEEKLFLAGDVRANEQIGLTAVHTLFVREHNHIADKIGEQFPTLGGNEIYEISRKLVGAEIQAITYNEFLPFLIGKRFTPVKGISTEFGGGFGLEAYKGYNSTLNPSVSNEFANAAYRLGHTLLNDKLLRVDKNGIHSIPLGSDKPSEAAFFNPHEVIKNGVNSLFVGLAWQAAQEFDHFIVDSVRNFLFPAGTGGLDLASVNIQRGRDVGLPGYVDVYNELGLDSVFGKIQDFKDLPFTYEAIDLFDDIYTSVDEIDLWIGGLAEKPINHGLLGPTFNLIVSDQFRAARDGDRFFYLNPTELKFLKQFDPYIEQTTLSGVIHRNTPENVHIQDNAFLAYSNIHDPLLPTTDPLSTVM